MDVGLVREQPEPIAIVGIGCRFPGGASTPSKLWDVLKEAPNTAKVIPQERFNLDRFYHPVGTHHGTSNVKETYFLDEDVRRFDAGFFNIPPPEAGAMDPQHRLLMETVYEAMEASGTTIEQLQGSNTSVFVGVMCSDYYILSAQDLDSVSTYNSTGIANSNASARLSYFFDWHGPCMTIDTACSSSLVAVHQAVQALRAGTSRVAVAAGTNLLLCPLGYISESLLGMLSPNGRCQMWDEKADGYARGEGVACVLLKKLSDAIADGDHVDCVIRETGVNQDGKTKGITMPSAVSQASLIQRTYRQAGLDPRNKRHRCQYFEAHGTGTPAGDPQEAEALDTAFFQDSERDANDILYVGSVKTVVGHTEGTAGLAGIIKACLSIKHGIISPNLHLDNLSPSVQPFCKNLEVVTSIMPWPELPAGQVRRASVNSFGFGGTNAHAILESPWSSDDLQAQVKGRTPGSANKEALHLPFLFSATSEKSLVALVDAYSEYLDNNPDVDLCRLAYTLGCRRSAFAFKTCFSAASQEELCSKLSESTSDQGNLSFVRSTTTNPSLLGVFTGQGAQWPRMGASLLQSSNRAMDIINELDASLTALPASDRPSWTLRDELLADASTSRVGEATIAQPLVCAVQILLVTLLRDAGVQFKSVVGHSSGEIAAAFAAGFINHHDAIRIAYYRGLHSKLARSASGEIGGMLATGLSYDEGIELCDHEDFTGRITVAASNSPASVTISGDLDALEQLQLVLEDEETLVRALRVDKAYHSHHMKPASGPFLESVRNCAINIMTPPNDAPTWFSSVYGGQVMEASDIIKGSYWVENLLNPVLFSHALEAALLSGDAFDAAVEIGPHPALKGPATDVMKAVTGKPIPYSGTLARGKHDVESFSDALGHLWTNAGPSSINLDSYGQAMYQDWKTIKILRDLPAYPWNRDRILWTESRGTKLWRQQEGKFHDILGSRCADGTEEEWRWKNLLHPKELPWVLDHALQGQTVFPGTGYLCLALEAAMQIAGNNSVQLLELTDLSIRKAIAIDESVGTETLVSMTKIIRTDEDITMAFACFSTVGKEASGLALNAMGNVRVQLGQPMPDILAPRPPPAHGMRPVSTDHFYSEVAKLGYNYGPTFRGICNLERKLGGSRGDIVGPPNDETGTTLLFHPGMLDAALQGMLVGFSSPGDGRLWSLHAPSSIRRVTLVPSLCGANMTPKVSFDCAVTDIECNELTGDVEVFQDETGYKSISVEGVAFIPFTAATASDDRGLFAHNVYGIESPNGQAALGSYRATESEIQKGVDCERVAFYYLRRLHEDFSQSERTALHLPRHHQALFDYAEYIYNIVQRGEHAYVKKEWMEDTYEQICSIMKRQVYIYGEGFYGPNDPDFQLTAASGENLPAVIRGETTILEHLTKDNKLNNYYQHALGFHALNDLIAATVKQIAHRYPRMNICEVGAGTGGASRRIFAELGTAYSSYTYTDISSGFFSKAQEDFAAYKDRMIYKTLDITVDPAEQGFEHGAYDLVVAANVLHATPDLVATLSNARKLLRPGGFLVMMEFTDKSVLRLGVIIGGLPGWWIGADTGRKHSPCVSLPEWNDILLGSGFAGIETSTPVLDPVVMPASIIVGQAVDSDLSLLREPTAASPGLGMAKNAELLIVGGAGAASAKVVEDVVAAVRPHYQNIVHVRSWDDPSADHGLKNPTVLSLQDLDGTVWRDMTVRRFERLKAVFLAAANVLWVTWGTDCENGDGAMTVGFFRSLAYELPQAILQVMDLEDVSKADGSVIVQRLLRLDMSSYMNKTGSLGRTMFSNEPELRFRDGNVLIPRCLPHVDQNHRYDSLKRVIDKEICLDESIATLNWSRSEYTLREDECAVLPFVADHRRVRVDSSLASSIVTPAGRLFFSLGTDMDTGRRVVSASSKNSSAILVPHKWSVHVDVGRSIDSQYLSFLSGYLLSRHLSSRMPAGGTVVVHEPDPGLASMMSRQLATMGCRVLFTTAATDVVRRNWLAMHPRIPDRQLIRALPTTCDLYLDLSATTPCPEGSSFLSQRISKMLPPLCERHDAGVVIARQSTVFAGAHDDAIHELLNRVNSFAAAQLNGVPDGMPLPMIPLSRILSSGDSATGNALRGIIQWHGEDSVPARVEPVVNRNDLFAADKTYWLVGLAGDLGRSICDFMVAQGARYIVLSSRNPEVNHEWVKDHAARGATVVYIAADITSENSLRASYDQIRANLPPVSGVANGTLVLKDRGLVNMDLETFHANTRCKVEGTEYLDALFPDNTLDWFIAFSSISATVGNMGQMAYTAANMFMKAIISQRRKRGVAGSVIDISQVFGVGYVERELKRQAKSDREQAMRLMGKSGTLVMSEPDLHQLFAEAVISGRAGSGHDPEIISGLRIMTPAESKDALWGGNVRFGHMIQETGTAKPPSATKTAAIPIRAQLEAAKDAEQISAMLGAAFKAKLKAALQVGEETLSVTTPLVDMGVDSLVAVEIRTWLANEVGADVAVLKILGGPSIQDLVEDIAVAIKGQESSSDSAESETSSNSEDKTSTPATEGSSDGSSEEKTE
ncbi:Polyketide synthase [Metarhizium humberi]|uniref:Polyketide synthase n=1 Tax=Metarhizium humberi TaxID=2596975 RepID=A0A9P8M9U6_9HYPO|nr:Polyketide synthase [Metarhizium humberi]